MVSKEDAGFRLKLAQRYLEWAESDFERRDWPRCVASAQLAIGNAGKSILACYGPVSRTHDTAEALGKLVVPALPEELAARIKEALPVFREYGSRMHIAATYGDERHLLTPWDIFQEEDAHKALQAARRSVRLAGEIFARCFK